MDVSAHEPAESLRFGDFELYPEGHRLLRAGLDVALRPKTFGVLCLLASRAGRVVTKDELLTSVWSEAAVSESVLATSISELRRVFREASQKTDFIQTVHGVGYRFQAVATGRAGTDLGADVADRSLPAGEVATEEAASHARSLRDHPAVAHFCGRVGELRVLEQQWDMARRGTARLVFVTGGAGEGKTSLVRTFARQVAESGGRNSDPSAGSNARVAVGQCLPEYDIGEPFLPIIESLGRLLRGPDGEELRDVVAKRGARWLPLLEDGIVDTALTRDRLLRELVEVLVGISAERALVLVLEDLHWGDPATLALLQALALRSDAMRLLVVATYRPVDAIVADREVGEIQRDIVLKNRGCEIPMSPLGRDELEDYFTRRYGAPALAADLAQTAIARTEGVPLFVVALADELESLGVLVNDGDGWRLAGTLADVAAAIPATIREMVERRIRALADLERRILEVGAVVGDDFSVKLVAEVLGEDAASIDDCCADVARRVRLLSTAGDTATGDAAADDTAAGYAAAGYAAGGGTAGGGTAGGGTDGDSRYRFSHVWYPTVLYQNLSTIRQRRLHEEVARRLAQRDGAVDAEVAVHFEQAGLAFESAGWRLRAARRLLRLYPGEEAVAHLQRGLEMLGRASGSATATPGADVEADKLRVDLQAHLAFTFMLLRGYTHPEVGEAYEELRALVRDQGDSERHLHAITGAALSRFAHAQLGDALALMSEGIAMGRRLRISPGKYVGLVLFTAETRLYQGAFRQSLKIVEEAEAMLASGVAEPTAREEVYLVAPAPYAMAMRAYALQILGKSEAAEQAGRDAISIAEEGGHLYTIVSALGFQCVRLGLRRDWARVADLAPRLLALTDAHGFDHWGWAAGICYSRALAADGDRSQRVLDLLDGSVAKRRAMGARFGRSLFRTWAAGVHAELGDFETALRWNESALSAGADSEERWSDATVLLAQADLLRRSGADPAVVTDWLRRARDTARDQGAVFFRELAEQELAE